MAGYSRYALLRMVPQNGEQETLDLMLAFSDAKGPVTIEEDHVLDIDRRININRKLASRLHGWRWRVRCTMHIVDMADQAYVAQIMNRAAILDEWTFYLSVDGGNSEEQVQVTGYDGPKPLGRKTAVGAEYSITFESVELLDEVPQIEVLAGVVPVPPVYIPTVYTLPNPSAAYRGRILLYRQTGIQDQVVVCKADADGVTYRWVAWESDLPPISDGSITVDALPTASATYLGVVAILDTGSGETAAYMCHRTAVDTYEWVYHVGGAIPDQVVTAEPEAASYDLGAVLLVDAGSGETYAIQRHDDGTDAPVWVRGSSGGSGS